MGEKLTNAAARRQAIIDLKQVFSGEQGERAFIHLQQAFAAHQPSFIAGGRTEDAILRDGAKHVLCYIRDMVNADPSILEDDAP
jgi:hypothetical protein